MIGERPSEALQEGRPLARGSQGGPPDHSTTCVALHAERCEVWSVGGDPIRALIAFSDQLGGYVQEQRGLKLPGMHVFVTFGEELRVLAGTLPVHLVVANMLQAVDGRWGALPTVELFRHCKTAGYLYQAILRGQLTERLGVAWAPVRNGYADIAGIPRPVVEHFSRRRGEITAELERRGDTGGSATAAQAATLATRGAKAKGTDEPTLRGAVGRPRRRGRIRPGPGTPARSPRPPGASRPPGGRSTRRRCSARRG